MRVDMPGGREELPRLERVESGRSASSCGVHDGSPRASGTVRKSGLVGPRGDQLVVVSSTSVELWGVLCTAVYEPEFWTAVNVPEPLARAKAPVPETTE